MVFSAIGRRRLTALCGVSLLAPHYLLTGWPDLCAVENGRLVLYEVKHRDRLKDDQVRTIPALKGVGIEVAVLRVG